MRIIGFSISSFTLNQTTVCRRRTVRDPRGFFHRTGVPDTIHERPRRADGSARRRH